MIPIQLFVQLISSLQLLIIHGIANIRCICGRMEVNERSV